MEQLHVYQKHQTVAIKVLFSALLEIRLERIGEEGQHYPIAINNNL